MWYAGESKDSRMMLKCFGGFPGSSAGKESTCNAGRSESAVDKPPSNQLKLRVVPQS